MSDLIRSLAYWLVDFFGMATTLLVVALALRWVIRQPALRMGLAWSTWMGMAAMAILIALPIWPRYELSHVVRAWLQPAEARIPIATDARLLVPESADAIPATEYPKVGITSQPFGIEDPMTASAQGSSATIELIVANGWLVAGTLAVFWIFIGRAKTRRLIARAKPVPLWVHTELLRVIGQNRRRPRLLASDGTHSAIALGAIRPQIVLPEASVVESNSNAIRAALAHEWAHIRRLDLWLLALERLLLPLLCLHPLFWLMRRSVRFDQELLADAEAAGDHRVEYAEALLAWAQSTQPMHHGFATIGMWESPHNLSRRVNMILDVKRSLVLHSSRWWTVMAATLLAPVVLGMPFLTFRPLTAQDPPAPRAEVKAALEAITDVGIAVGAKPELEPQPGKQILLDIQVLSVPREKLAAADTTLEDLIAELTDSRCRRESGLIIAEVSSPEVTKFTKTLQSHSALKILSQPRAITLDGREAVLRIGGELPLLRIEETINGKQNRRVEFKEFGTTLMVRPKLNLEQDNMVRLEIVAEQANLVPIEPNAEGSVPRNAPGLVSHKFTLTGDVKLGSALLVAESPAKKQQLRAAIKEQFVVIVIPQRVPDAEAGAYLNPLVADRERGTVQIAPPTETQAKDGKQEADPESKQLQRVLRELEDERAQRAQEREALKRELDALKQALERTRDPSQPNDSAKQTVVFRLKHTLAEDATKVLNDLLSKSEAKDGKLVSDPVTNALFVQGEQGYVTKVAEIIKTLDQPAPVKDNSSLKLEKDKTSGSLRRIPLGGSQALSFRVYPLKHRSAAEVSKELGELLSKTSSRVVRITSDARANALLVEDDERFDAEIQKLVELLDRAAAESAPKGSPAEATDPQGLGLTAQEQLLELDLAEAKLSVEEAQARMQQMADVQKKSPGSVPASETRQQQFAVDRAKIQVQRIMIKLEAVRAKSGGKTKDLPSN